MTADSLQTYCLKPIGEAKDCKEHCNASFRRPCLQRFSDSIYGNLSSKNKEKDPKDDFSKFPVRQTA